MYQDDPVVKVDSKMWGKMNVEFNREEKFKGRDGWEENSGGKKQ